MLVTLALVDTLGSIHIEKSIHMYLWHCLAQCPQHQMGVSNMKLWQQAKKYVDTLARWWRGYKRSCLSDYTSHHAK